MSDEQIKSILLAQVHALKEVRDHLIVIKHVLREKGWISDEDYAVLLNQVRGAEESTALARAEIAELNRMLDLKKPEAPEG